MRRIFIAATLATLGVAATPAVVAAQDQAASTAPDPALKVPEVLAFAGAKPGDKVADVIGGKLTELLLRAVGPKGHVYAVETAEIARSHPSAIEKMAPLAKAYPNLTVTAEPIASPLPAGLDVVFIRQNYHDLYDKFMGPADVPAFDRAVFAALKPGGVFVVLDHAAAAGSGIAATETLHRIDPARVKADALAAGFRFDGESKLLANPADDHTKGVFDPSVRGKTDQFLLRFRKPGE